MTPSSASAEDGSIGRAIDVNTDVLIRYDPNLRPSRKGSEKKHRPITKIHSQSLGNRPITISSATHRIMAEVTAVTAGPNILARISATGARTTVELIPATSRTRELSMSVS